MKKVYSHGLSALLLLGSLSALAQHRPAGPTYSLGTNLGFVRELETQVATSTARRQAPTVTLRVSATQAFTGKVNYREDLAATGEFVVGEIQGVPGASFRVRIDGPQVEGHLVLPGTKRAFRYSADAQGNAAVQEVDINQVLCVGYNLPAGYVAPKRASGSTANRAATLSLQSLPGARGCLLLDVDGYDLPAGTGWNNGKAYSAPPANMPDADVQGMWELVSEDFRFLNLNVTTDENVYNAYPAAMRKRCVVSPGSRETICPQAAGVATLYSFGDESPCWTFLTDNPKYAGETTSHEVGHTLGLSHDGRTPVEEYYSGKDRKNWAPIMGAGFSKPVSQWSKGDYGLASNKEDDLAIMSGPRNNLGYRSDDHANNASGATALARSGNNVSGNGLIGSTTDQDYFSFTTSGGAVSLNVNTVDPYGNLDIVARLFDANGALLGTYDTPAPNINVPNLNATVSATLGAGTYFLQVDGTGSGDPATDGYSDYGSLGTFTIAGTIPASTTPPPSGVGVATLLRDCSFTGTAVTLPVGDFTLSQLQARGIFNNDVSSLGVTSGFEVVLFDGDNFQGESITVVGNEACLIGRSFNDRISSVRVRPVSTATLYQHCGFDGYAVALPAVGTYSMSQLQALGFVNDDISSLRVSSGVEVVLYADDNLGGASLLVGADTDCLIGAGFNDRVSSVLVRNAANAPANAANTANAPTVAELVASLRAPLAFSVYPNPVAAELTIGATQSLRGSQFEVLDAQGRTRLKGAGEAGRIDVSGLPAGVYTLRVLREGQRPVTTRFVK